MELHLEKKYNSNKFLPELIFSTIGRENVYNVLFLQLIPLISSPYLFVSFGGGTSNEHSNANPWFPIDKARNENHWGVRARRVLAQCSWSITRHPRAMSRVRRPLHPLPLPNQTYFFPFFFHLPPNPPLLLVVSCLPLHFPVPLPPPRYDHAPLSSLITSSLHPHIERGHPPHSNETWHAHVDRRFAHSLFSSFSLPSVGGCSRRRGGVKRVGEGRGGVDLCQIKLKPPLSPHLSLDAGHSEYGFALGIRGVSIVGDWSPTTTFPPFPHFFPLYLLL